MRSSFQTKSYINLKHPSSTPIRSHSFPNRFKINKYQLNTLTSSQFESILLYLKLNDILLLQISLKSSSIFRQLNKTLINHIIKSNRKLDNNEQRQFMETIIKQSKNLLKVNKVSRKSWCEQIISQDVQRTFLQYPQNQQQTERMKKYLNNVLCSLSNIFINVGYVQGINFIIRNMYQNRYTEAQALKYTSYLFSQMKVQLLFAQELSQVQQLCYVFQVYMFNYLPKVYSHLKKMSVTTYFFAPSWFITLYSQHLPYRTVNKIWNLFLIKGWKIIIKFGLSILCIQNDQIFTFMKQILQYVDQYRMPIIWQIMASLKVTNKMIARLSKEMDRVQKDAEIQIWRLKNKKQSHIKHLQLSSLNKNQSQINSPILLNNSFSSKLCCGKYGQQSSNGVFELCQNVQLN